MQVTLQILNDQEEWVEGSPSEIGQRYRKLMVFNGDSIAHEEGIFAGISPVSSLKITPKSFLSRFTVDEFVAIELASIDVPQAEISQRQLSAQLRLYLMKINSARYIDLNSAETVDGINSLIQHGFITSTRAYEVLNNPVGQLESV